MKIKYLILLLFLFVPVSVNADNIYSLKMDVHLTSNGDANITEVWNVKASGGSEWYKEFKDMENTVFDDSSYKAYMDGKPLNRMLVWNINRSMSEKCGYYGKREITTGFEINFGKCDMKSHIFTIKYTLKNYIYTASDSQILYATMFPRVTADNFQVTVYSDKAFNKKLDVWGYGYKGYAYVKDGKIFMSSDKSLKEEYVVLLVKFPLNTFNTTNSSSNFSNFNSVLSMAEAGAKKWHKSWNDNPFVIFIECIIVMFIIPAAIIFFITYGTNRLRNKFLRNEKHSYYKNNKKVKYDEVPMFREIPCDKNIYYANTLLYLNGIDYADSNIFGALVLKWAKDNKIKFLKADGGAFSEKNGRIQFFDNIKFDIPLEEKIYTILRVASKDDILDAKELKAYCKDHYSMVGEIFKSINLEELDALEKNSFISKPTVNWKGSIVYALNDRVYEDSVKLIGLKKYLTEFSRINTREVMDVKLWDEYLMFAYLFGIADKVAEQLKNLYPKEALNMAFDYNIVSYITDITIDSAQVMATQKVVSAAFEAATEYSGGGGGFSSSGGGGGSIGGGGGSSMGGR